MSNVFKISQSKMKTWRRCHHAYHLKYVQKLRRKRKSRPLAFGTLVHEMIEAHINGRDPADVLAAAEKTQGPMFRAEIEEYGDILNDARVIMSEYFEHWGDDSLTYVKVNKRWAEHEFNVEIAPGIMATGKIDAYALTPNKRRWLVEHKSFKNMPGEDERWRGLQSSLYAHVNNLLGFKPIDGICWDYIRSKAPSKPQVLKNGKIGKRALDTLPLKIIETADELGIKHKDLSFAITSATKNRERYFERIYTPIRSLPIELTMADFIETAEEIREKGSWSKARNIDRHCSWCEYEPICRADLKRHDTDFIIRNDFYVEQKAVEERPVE